MFSVVQGTLEGMSDDKPTPDEQPRPTTPQQPHRPAPPPPGGGSAGWSASPGSAPDRPAPWSAGHQSSAGAGDTSDPNATPAAADATATPGPEGTNAPGDDGTATAETSVFGTPTPPPAATSEPRRKGRGRLVLAGLAIGAILGGGAGAGVTQLLDDDEQTASPERSSLETGADNDDNADGDDTGSRPAADANDVQQVADIVLPSVVSITTRSELGQAGGTGVIISSDGEILTNNHVVQGAGQGGIVQVTLADNTTVEAEVLGTDPLTDLAVIKAQDVSDLTPAELGSSSDTAVGQDVVAIGSPLGLDGTVTTGIVSALNRPVTAGEQQGGGATSVIDAIQTDAPINPGNSGGPLVNMNGEVIGINSAIATAGQNSGSIGLGFAIPIDQAKPIVEELLGGQEASHAQIGVGVTTSQDTRGAVIASVNGGSAGAEAGLQEGDIVTAVDDRHVSSDIELIAAVRSYRPGDEITLTYLRDGDEQTTELTLGSDARTT